MSSRKRPSASTSRGRPKRVRATPSVSTAMVVPPATASTVDMAALTATLTAAVTSAVQAAMKTPNLPTDEPPASEGASTAMTVEEAVSEQLAIARQRYS